jgi:hypothetical protein
LLVVGSDERTAKGITLFNDNDVTTLIAQEDSEGTRNTGFFNSAEIFHRGTVG